MMHLLLSAIFWNSASHCWHEAPGWCAADFAKIAPRGLGRFLQQVKNGYRLDDFKESNFKNSYPTRVMMSPKYTDDCKGFILDITQDEQEYITDEFEKQLYLFSFGKLNVDEIADRFTKLMPEKTKNEIIENFMIPTYKKWEDLYHLFFVY